MRHPGQNNGGHSRPGKGRLCFVGQPDFPKIVIGRGYYIPKAAFEKWIQKYTGKEYRLK